MTAKGRIAIISDIHGNLEALKAVLEDIKLLDADAILCLGDVVGYGPNPAECVDIARRFDATIMGNHEEALLYEEKSVNFNFRARAAINWTREILDRHGGTDDRNGRWEFIGERLARYETGGMLFVHGSPRDPIHEYLFPGSAGMLGDVFEMFDRACFIGHTHMAGVFTPALEHLFPEDISNRYYLGQKAIINVGSVGQPRDGNNQASYVIYDEADSMAIFRRVSYDFVATLNKIRSIEDLHDSLGERLAVGK